MNISEYILVKVYKGGYIFMEYSKDIIFNIKYNGVDNVLEATKNKKWTSSIKGKLKKIKENKVIAVISLSCVTLIIFDIVLIYNFVHILQNTSFIL